MPSADNNTKLFMQDMPAAASNEIVLVKSGAGYFKLLLDLIALAEESIHLQTYIFAEDRTGTMVADALKEAAKRKVAVYLLVDGYASQKLSAAFISSLRDAAVNFRFFEPLFHSSYFYFGRRMHHKLFVSDRKHALVGGINIADRYNSFDDTVAWLDFAVHVRGKVAEELDTICRHAWRVSGRKSTGSIRILPALPPPASSNSVQVKRNDWVKNKNEISSSYISMLRHAKSDVTIMCSYFLPGRVIRKFLRSAVHRGVKVTVITAGESDIWIAKSAERWLYDWLLRNQIALYEYQPSVLHAKIAIADAAWMTVGSYNINDISTYASIELNIDIIDKQFAGSAKEEVDRIIINDCRRIELEASRFSKNIFIQFIRWSSYWIIRMLFHLFTFYFRRHRTVS